MLNFGLAKKKNNNNNNYNNNNSNNKQNRNLDHKLEYYVVWDLELNLSLNWLKLKNASDKLKFPINW